MDVTKTGNLVEAALWFVVTAVLAFKATRASGGLRLVFVLLSLAFLVFGATDLIESGTGAWWKPLWLLLLKALCVAGILFGFARYYTIARRNQPEPEESVSD